MFDRVVHSIFICYGRDQTLGGLYIITMIFDMHEVFKQLAKGNVFEREPNTSEVSESMIRRSGG